MALVALSLDTLRRLDDGRAVVAFDKELSMAVMDCMDRPGDASPRKVTLEMTIIPRVADDGSLDEVKADFQIKGKVPIRRTRRYSFDVRRQRDGADTKARLMFSESSPTDIKQTTLDDLNHETGRVERPEETEA